ncbi:MAG: restriction endonuclease subunit S [Gaiellaceae bacterium]
MKDLPEGWAWTKVGDAGHVMLGRQRAPKYHDGRNMRPYLRVKNVFEDRIDLRDVKEMEFSSADFERYRLEPGDILLNEGQSPELVGRPAMYRGELPGACFTNSLIRFRPHEEVEGRYSLYLFRYYLHSGRFHKEARITTNIAHLSSHRFAGVEFPVPPLAEQRRIAAAIEEHFSRLDAAEGSLRRATRRLDAVRRSVIASAFAEAQKNVKGLRPIGEFASLADGPFGSNLKTSHYTASGPRVVRLQNVGDGEFRDERAHIEPSHFERLRKHEVVAGDVVAASLGETAPRACLIPPWLGLAIVKADCIRIRPADDVDRAFLMWMLNSAQVEKEASTSIKGIGRPRLGLGGMKRLSIPTPPLSDQRRIVAEVERRLSLVDALAAATTAALKRSGALRRSILERAFTGKLVPQDPTDEPASVLLERIKTEQAAETPARKTRRSRSDD